MLVHPHVRGADVHEPNGAALPRTTRYRDFPQFWGYGAQRRLVDVEHAALMRIPAVWALVLRSGVTLMG